MHTQMQVHGLPTPLRPRPCVKHTRFATSRGCSARLQLQRPYQRQRHWQHEESLKSSLPVTSALNSPRALDPLRAPHGTAGHRSCPLNSRSRPLAEPRATILNSHLHRDSFYSYVLYMFNSAIPKQSQSSVQLESRIGRRGGWMRKSSPNQEVLRAGPSRIRKPATFLPQRRLIDKPRKAVRLTVVFDGLAGSLCCRPGRPAACAVAAYCQSKA